MKRRDFLKLSSMATMAASLNGLPIHAFGESKFLSSLKQTRGLNDNILVLIQMQGGNDGLNTIIPLDRYSELSNARSNVLLNQSAVLTLAGNPTTGMHPSLNAMRGLYYTDKLNIIQGVSYPNPSYSHFRATDIMMSGSDSNSYLNTGWIGRFIDSQFPGAPQAYPSGVFSDPLSIQIGNSVSSILTGVNGLNGLALSDISSFYNIMNSTVDPAPNTPAGHELTYVRFIAQQTQAYTTVIEAAANAGNNLGTYPSGNNLADQLKIVARLISGGLRTPIYVVNISGFDTHDNQTDSSNTAQGKHANLLKKLSDAIGAFQYDLELLGKDDKVTGCTFSEFGRRVKSNASGGTDHGSGAPMFVFGKHVNPAILGSSPVIPMNADLNDNVPMQFDYRDVYSTILTDWFGLTANETSAILGGQTFQHLAIFKNPTGLTSTEANTPQLGLEQNFPNPFRSHTTIRFTTTGGEARIMLYDDMGRTIKEIYHNDLPAGTFDIGFDRGNLAVGTYFYELQIGYQKFTKKLSVVD